MNFVELFGMPASGKTFFIKKLKNNNKVLNDNNLYFYFSKKSLTSFLFKFFNILVSLPLIIFSDEFRRTIIFFQKHYRPKKSLLLSLRTSSIFFNTLFLISIIKIYKTLKSYRTIYIDQGFFQILFSIIYEMNIQNEEKQNNIIGKWIDIFFNLKIKHLVIYYSASDKLITKRLLKRKGDSLIEKNSNSIYSLLDYQKIFDDVLGFLIKRKTSYPKILLSKIKCDQTSIKQIEI